MGVEGCIHHVRDAADQPASSMGRGVRPPYARFIAQYAAYAPSHGALADSPNLIATLKTAY